ncbi:MAG: Histidine--tRNA ligase [Actinobacteria bacterium ADurb.Bin346]|nr:MAG: Histidine--tRNA ligase [Actinobacteria bacterium ADurb.Bin346]
MVLSSPRGTNDVFGEDIKYRDFIINSAKDLFRLFNYSEIITPAFEHTEVFDRGIGKSTDIVKKEMYTFTDKKGRSLTLRPEGTASVVRAIIEHKMYSEKIPVKLFYIGNMFRYERPQKGRMREFSQLGVEAAGVAEPFIDAEVIWILNSIFDRIGFRNLKLMINSVGCEKCRRDYIRVFKSYIKPEVESFCPDCKVRYDTNPLRIFDCKVEQCKKIIEGSPKIYQHICADCREHILKVCHYLEKMGINYFIKEELVRGFDYYTGTIFEIISDDLESVQNALGGGGRYDNLIAQFGGPPMPSIGFAIGIDRTILLMRQLNIKYLTKELKSAAYIALLSDKFYDTGLKVTKLLRENNIPCDISYKVRPLSSQIKTAVRDGFSHFIAIGDDEIKTGVFNVKNLEKHTQFKLNINDSSKNISAVFRSSL